MTPLNLNDVVQYVEQNINTFHDNRIAAIQRLKLNKVLTNKNPYLFKAKNVLTSQEIVKGVTDAYISSQEESIFGNWMEGLALFINQKVYKGWKSGIQGIDIEFDNNNNRYIVTVKSGPNWGNASQIKKLESDFKTAKITLRTSNARINVVAINGCCYGKTAKADKGEYFKYCGKIFWEFISGDPDLYVKIIEPLGHSAQQRNDDFVNSYSSIINRFTSEFSQLFVLHSGAIDWVRLVKFNSGSA